MKKTDIKNLKINQANLEKMELSELLSLEQGISLLIDYYDNFARANEGHYEFDTKAFYDESKDKVFFYNTLRKEILNVIETKVLENCAK